MVILTLVSSHKSLASQLITCGVTPVLEKCLALSQNETMLAIIALNHIFVAQKLDNKGKRFGPKRSFAPPLDTLTRSMTVWLDCVFIYPSYLAI